MQTMIKRMLFGSMLQVSSAACGPVQGPSDEGDASALRDAASDSSDAGASDGGQSLDDGGSDARQPPLDAGRSPSDSGVPMSDGGDPCARGEVSVERWIGASGGTLTLCDASVSIQPGALSQNFLFRFVRTGNGPRPVGPFAIDGFVYRLESNAPRPTVTLRLPHGSDSAGIDLFEHKDGVGWAALGLCEVRDGFATQTYVGLGTFALLHDVRNIPTSPRGLGTASVNAQIGGRSRVYRSGPAGYSGVSALPNGARIVTFQVHAEDGSILQVEVLSGPGEAMMPWSVAHQDANGAVEWWTPAYGERFPMDLTMVPLIDGLQGRLVGSVRTEGGDALRIDARFVLTLVDWKELPTRVCGARREAIAL